MTHYTLIANRPEGDLLPRLRGNRHFKQSAPNQWVLWDGPARLKDMRQMFELIVPHCRGLSLFSNSQKLKKSRQVMDLGDWH